MIFHLKFTTTVKLINKVTTKKSNWELGFHLPTQINQARWIGGLVAPVRGLMAGDQAAVAGVVGGRRRHEVLGSSRALKARHKQGSKEGNTAAVGGPLTAQQCSATECDVVAGGGAWRWWPEVLWRMAERARAGAGVATNFRRAGAGERWWLLVVFVPMVGGG